MWSTSPNQGVCSCFGFFTHSLTDTGTADNTGESWHTVQCCPPSLLPAVPCNTPYCVPFRAFVFADNSWGLMQLHWKLKEGIGSPTSCNWKHFIWLHFFFPQQSVPRAWALVVWWLTLLARVSWYWDSFFCFTTDFLCPWESRLIYYSLNTAEKTMLFFLSKGAGRTTLLSLRGERVVLRHPDRQKNGTFQTEW